MALRAGPRAFFSLSVPALLVVLAAALGACSGQDASITATAAAPGDGVGGSDPAAPGSSGSGGPVAGDAGSGDAATAPTCADAEKRCGHDFWYSPPSGLGPASRVEVRGDWNGNASWQTGAPMTSVGGVWKATVSVPWNVAVHYKFVVDGATWITDPSKPTATDPAGNVNNVLSPLKCSNPTCPPSSGGGGDGGGGGGGGGGGASPFDWRDAVIYSVFVDRFFDGNTANNCSVPFVTAPIANYNGGDWAGVTQKINDGFFGDLGVNVLLLTVPFKNTKSPGGGIGGDAHTYSAYHGYWPDDPAQAEPCFGTKAELVGLVSAAHAKGLKVIFDYAMVHVHETSAVYQTHSSWFWPNDNGRGGNCICGEGCSWDVLPDRERCRFTGYLPHWNYTVPAARDYSVDTALAWIDDTGVDGLRLDAIKHVDASWLAQLRARVTPKVPRRFYMVGETYDFENRGLLASFVDPATKLDGQFDFPLRRRILEAVLMRKAPMTELEQFMATNEGFYGASAVMSPFIGNHDLPRVIHMGANGHLWNEQWMDGKDRAWNGQPGIPGELEAFERVANGFAIIFTNPGAPLLYYGDEIGLPGAGDPDNRRFMQWSGLSSNQTFLRDRVKKLLAIRAAHPALRGGTRQTLQVDGDVWVYSRTTAGDTVHVVVNRGDSTRSVGSLPSGALTELVTGASTTGPSVTVPPRQTRIFVK